MINRLRAATKELHEQLENENKAKLIIDHSISLGDYKTLLLQNFLAYRIVEREIAKFIPQEGTAKHEQLAEDLQNLGIQAPAELTSNFSCNDYFEALGAAYVVEGSALGGMMISKELKQCPNLQEIAPQHFFSGDRSGVKSWNSFLKRLNKNEFSETEKEKAAQKAVETFQVFGRAFKLERV